MNKNNGIKICVSIIVLVVSILEGIFNVFPILRLHVGVNYTDVVPIYLLTYIGSLFYILSVLQKYLYENSEKYYRTYMKWLGNLLHYIGLIIIITIAIWSLFTRGYL